MRAEHLAHESIHTKKGECIKTLILARLRKPNLERRTYRTYST